MQKDYNSKRMLNWMDNKDKINISDIFQQTNARALAANMRVTKRVELKVESSRGKLHSIKG